MPKPEVRNSIGSIYMRDNKIWQFDGEMTKKGLLDHMSADNYKNSTILEDDFEEYVYNVQDRDLDYKLKIKKKFEELSLFIETQTEKKFKKIPLASNWSKTAKVLIVTSFIIPPVVFTGFFCILWIMVFF